jgi:hypothetical protein
VLGAPAVCSTDHYLVVKKFREGILVCEVATQALIVDIRSAQCRMDSLLFAGLKRAGVVLRTHTL